MDRQSNSQSMQDISDAYWIPNFEKVTWIILFVYELRNLYP